MLYVSTVTCFQLRPRAVLPNIEFGIETTVSLLKRETDCNIDIRNKFNSAGEISIADNRFNKSYMFRGGTGNGGDVF